MVEFLYLAGAVGSMFLFRQMCRVKVAENAAEAGVPLFVYLALMGLLLILTVVFFFQMFREVLGG